MTAFSELSGEGDMENPFRTLLRELFVDPVVTFWKSVARVVASLFAAH